MAPIGPSREQQQVHDRVWHTGLFGSGPNGNQGQMRDFWRILYGAGVDLVVNGHDHLYGGLRHRTRTVAVTTSVASGVHRRHRRREPVNFVTTSANSEARISNTFGVLKLTLRVAAISGNSSRFQDRATSEPARVTEIRPYASTAVPITENPLSSGLRQIAALERLRMARGTRPLSDGTL
jgi:hypothetical protein